MRVREEGGRERWNFLGGGVMGGRWGFFPRETRMMKTNVLRLGFSFFILKLKVGINVFYEKLTKKKALVF